MPRTVNRLLLLVLLVPLACSDRNPAGPELDDPPTNLAISLPESAVSGEAFDLMVNALDATGEVDVTWSGTVTLSATSGTLSPGTIELAEGVATVEATLGGAGEVSVTARSGQVEASGTLTVLGHDPVARLEIVPGSLLLPETGMSRPLAARAFDAEDRPVVAAVAWRSSDESVVSVSDEGVATAVTALGSAQITAEADGVVSAPAIAMVARPAEGATLVPDTQLVGVPEPVDPTAEYGIGWQYRATLTGIEAPEIGSILVGSGEAPVGGRVVAVAPGSDEVTVTLELVPIEEMFEALVLRESVDLGQADVVVPADVRRAFEVSRSGRSIDLRLRSGSRSPASPNARQAALDLLEFDLGPFRCEVESTVAPLQLTGTASFTVTPDLTFTLDYDSGAGGLQRLTLQGDVQAEIKAEPRVETAFESKVDCAVELAQITLPIGGPVALIFGGHVPLGVGFEVAGGTTVANVGVRLDLRAEASTEIGIDCTAGACEMINTYDSDADGSVEPTLPDPSGQFKVGLRAFPYGFAKLEIGNALLRRLRFETFEIRAGMAQTIDVAPPEVQVADPGYGSNFKLSIFGQAAAGSKIEDFLGMLDISLATVGATVDVPLAQSPGGTFSIEPATVRAGDDEELGDPATFTVTLDPVTYLGFDAVEAVELRWKRDDGEGGFILGNGRPGCTSMSADPGQTTFTCQADFLEAHEGEQTFYAFVHAKLFGLPLPVPLEIAGDGKAVVAVEVEEEDEEEELLWTFDDDLDGWTALEQGTPKEPPYWGQVDWRSWFDGIVALDGQGPGLNAAIRKSVQIPSSATTLAFRTSPHDREGALGDLRVRAEADGESIVILDWERLAGEEGIYRWVERSADVSSLAGRTVTIVFEHRDPTGDWGINTQRYLDDISVR